MPSLILLVGPPGSGKSTEAKRLVEINDSIYVNQDSQGKDEHKKIFDYALKHNQNVVVDRMNFSKEQRERYLAPAKAAGYTTYIQVHHESYDTCLERMKLRTNHETIKDEATARKVLHFFFTKYERPSIDEADYVVLIWPKGPKPNVIWCDLDGTLADVEHRRHFVRKEGKKDWKGFFQAMSEDPVVEPVLQTINNFANAGYKIAYCSGRPDDYKKQTTEWLINKWAPAGDLFMRRRNDNRPDNVVKEIILDFEVLTRYTPYICLDDRDQVVKMLRNRGLTVWQVAEGDF